nr:MAG TPA: hypothetical protein [Caudoviricetes sp.]
MNTHISFFVYAECSLSINKNLIELKPNEFVYLS